MKRFLPALLLTLTVVLSAPFVGVVRTWLFDSFPDLALHLLAIALLAWLLTALALAIRRIRHRRALRYAGLVVVVILLVVQYVGFGDDSIEVKLVEKIHIVEYGLLAWLLYRPLLRSHRDDRADDLSLFLLPLLGVLIAGTLDEGMQFVVMTRMGLVQDIVLDLFAGVCGLLFSLCMEPPRRFVFRLGPGRVLADALAAAVLVFGVFFSYAHLGHRIDDPEIGSFRSWHTRDALLRAAEERAGRWAEKPLRGVASPWLREDLFVTEAGWHLGHRNRNLKLAEDERYPKLRHYYWAAQANRILERYYKPYLDLPPFPGRGPRRLDPELVREIEATPPPEDLAGGYLSPVFHDRLYLWPSRSAMLGFTVLLSILLATLPRLSSHRNRPQTLLC